VPVSTRSHLGFTDFTCEVSRLSRLIFAPEARRISRVFATAT